MATITEIRHMDDVEAARGRQVEAERPDVPLGLDGRSFLIDLSEKNYRKLHEVLAPYIAAARRSSGNGSRATAARRSASSGPARRVAPDREQNMAIRAWARARGMECSDRGRIPADVLEAYHDEGPGTAPAATVEPRPTSRPTTPAEAAPAEPPTAEAPPAEPEAPAEPQEPMGAIGRARAKVAAARAAGQLPAEEPTPVSYASKADYNRAVREWAASKGVKLAERGAIPRDVLEQHVREYGEPVLD